MALRTNNAVTVTAIIAATCIVMTCLIMGANLVKASLLVRCQEPGTLCYSLVHVYDSTGQYGDTGLTAEHRFGLSISPLESSSDAGEYLPTGMVNISQVFTERGDETAYNITFNPSSGDATRGGTRKRSEFDVSPDDAYVSYVVFHCTELFAAENKDCSLGLSTFTLHLTEYDRKLLHL